MANFSKQQATTAPKYDHLEGLIERVTYHSPDNGFCVLKVKAKGHKDLVAVLGHSPDISAGEYITASGLFETSRDHGRQFKAEWLKVTTPTSLEGITKFLGSGMVKGLGPVYAGRLVDKFGENVFDIIEQNPEKLLEVEGIGKIRKDKIANGWTERKAIKDIMVFLHGHGVSTSRAVRIYKTYGNEAIETIKSDPYQLARDITGIGFLSADKIALSMGTPLNSLQRIRSGLNHTLFEATSNGHCGLPVDKLMEKTKALLNPKEGDPVVTDTLLHGGLEQEQIAQNIIREEDELGTPMVYAAALYSIENQIAFEIKRIRDAKLSPSHWTHRVTSDVIEAAYSRAKITPSNSQRNAVELLSKSLLGILTGGPGCGKSTLVNSLIKIYEMLGLNLVLCSPTGKAAKRLTEITGMEAKTIHRLLGIKPDGKPLFNQSNPVEADVIVVDEVSMVDVYLMNNLLRAVGSGTAILFVGDVDQLPSVGPGNVLRDMIESGVTCVSRLTEIFRQAASSKIITSAHTINSGEVPKFANLPEDDMFFIQKEEYPDILTTIVEVVARRLPKKYGFDPIKDIQVLCPMNRGETGARSFNESLQAVLNPKADYKKSVSKFGIEYRIGDKVMQIKNDYNLEVFNGDIGFIRDVKEDEDGEFAIIEFSDKQVKYPVDDFDQLVLAYASTIHKFQGSETPVVVIPVSMQHYTLLQKNLIYTGVTRGKKLVVLVGQSKALWYAIKKGGVAVRHTRLKLVLAKNG